MMTKCCSEDSILSTTAAAATTIDNEIGWTNDRATGTSYEPIHDHDADDEGSPTSNTEAEVENLDHLEARLFQRRLLPSLSHGSNWNHQFNQQPAYLNDGTRRCVSADAVLTPTPTPPPEYYAAAAPTRHPELVNRPEMYRNVSAETPIARGQGQFHYPPHEGDAFAPPYYGHRHGHGHPHPPPLPGHVLNPFKDERHWRGDPISELLGAYITGQGFITLHLRNDIWVDLTVDKAIRIVNYENNIIMAVSACGTKSGFIHPSGSVYQYLALDPETSNRSHDARIELSTNEQYGPLKYAKIGNKGITFSGNDHALIYIVDPAGTRSTSATFSDMTGDFCLPVFLDTSTHAPIAINECTRLLQTAQFWAGSDGTENWIINGIRISQEADGSVRIARDSLRYQLRTSPRNGNGSISTPHLHCTASVDGHIFVRRGSKRVHFDGHQLIARNGSHSSGFDGQNRLKLF